MLRVCQASEDYYREQWVSCEATRLQLVFDVAVVCKTTACRPR